MLPFRSGAGVAGAGDVEPSGVAGSTGSSSGATTGNAAI
jgi:hypothetical protein